MGSRRNILQKMVREYERELLEAALERFNGQALAIAKHFKMTRTTLYNRLEAHGINLTIWREAWRRHPRIENGVLIVPYGERHSKRKYTAKKRDRTLNP